MIRRTLRSTLFPTRRSSDLGDVVAAKVIRIPGPVEALVMMPHDGANGLQRSQVAAQSIADDGMRLDELELLRFERSEEHTSELQSRLHLVCRLLLEKKKEMS